MPIRDSGLATALSPALEAAPVDDGQMSPSMLVTIPPGPSPFLELDNEVGLLPMAVVVVSTTVVAMAEVVATLDKVLVMLGAPLRVPAAICCLSSAIAQSLD
jgi:hypothetical protein